MNRLVTLRGKDGIFVDAFDLKEIGPEIDSSDCVYMVDGFDFLVFEMLKTKKTIPRFIVCDGGFPCGSEIDGYDVLFVPDLRYGQQNYIRSFVKENTPMVDVCNTDRNFNFSVNIYRLDRILMMKLISWFGLTDCRYTWRGQGANCDMSPIIREMKNITAPWMTKQLKNHLLAPVSGFVPQWTETNTVPIVREYGIVPNSQVNNINDTWIKAIRPLMENTAISVICESSSRPNLPLSHLSEKTICAILSATFPIWIGNYGQADLLQEIGFDVFSDVIDHSYQHLPTMLERCYHALMDNIDILTHPTKAKELRHQHWDRLIDNRDRALKQNILGKYAIEQSRKLPVEIQERLEYRNDGCTFPTDPAGS